MGLLRIFREVAAEHREVTGATPSQQLQDGILAVMAFVILAVDLGTALIIQGGR